MRNPLCWFSLLLFACFSLGGALPLSAAVPTQVWVDSHWTGADSCGGHTWQIDAFNHIQPALTAVTPGGTVIVAAGSYPEKLVINKSLTLDGPGSGVNPNAATSKDLFAENPLRNDPKKEAVILPPAVDLNVTSGLLVSIYADDVTLDGLTLDGHNPALIGGVTLNGIPAQIACGVGEEGGHPQRFALLNNIIRNFVSRGISFKDDPIDLTQPADYHPSLGDVIINNRLDNLAAVAGAMPEMQEAPTGIGIYLYNSVYPEVLGNTILRTAVGLWVANYHDHSGELEISDNAIQAYVSGIGINTINGGADGILDMRIARNHLYLLDWAKPQKIERYAMYLLTIAGGDFSVSENDIHGGDVGVMLWNIQAPSHLLLSGGSIADCRYGIIAANQSSIYGTAYLKEMTRLVVDHVSIANSRQAAIFLNDDPAGEGPVNITVANGTNIRGGQSGIILRGAHAHLRLEGPAAIAFENIAGIYLALQYNGASAPGDLSVRDILFAGKHRAEMTPNEAASWQNKLIDHRVDQRVGQIIY